MSPAIYSRRFMPRVCALVAHNAQTWSLWSIWVIVPTGTYILCTSWYTLCEGVHNTSSSSWVSVLRNFLWSCLEHFAKSLVLFITFVKQISFWLLILWLCISVLNVYWMVFCVLYQMSPILVLTVTDTTDLVTSLLLLSNFNIS